MAALAIQIAMQHLHSAGLAVTLTPGKGVKVSPASAITETMRALIVAHKAGIVAYLSEAANDPAPLSAPVQNSRPHSTSMNTAEIDRFTARLERFTDRGVIQGDAECLADRLVIRDREQDDRAMCMECTHLQRGGRCGNWQRAGVAIRSRDAQLATEFMHLLQRCDGFTTAH
jgi:hypothetical protein